MTGKIQNDYISVGYYDRQGKLQIGEPQGEYLAVKFKFSGYRAVAF